MTQRTIFLLQAFFLDRDRDYTLRAFASRAAAQAYHDNIASKLPGCTGALFEIRECILEDQP